MKRFENVSSNTAKHKEKHTISLEFENSEMMNKALQTITRSNIPFDIVSIQDYNYTIWKYDDR